MLPKNRHENSTAPSSETGNYSLFSKIKMDILKPSKKIIIILSLLLVIACVAAVSGHIRKRTIVNKINYDDTETHIINGREMKIPKAFINTDNNWTNSNQYNASDRIQELETRISQGYDDYETRYLLAGFYFENNDIAKAIENYNFAKLNIDHSLDGHQETSRLIDEKIKQLEAEL